MHNKVSLLSKKLIVLEPQTIDLPRLKSHYLVSSDNRIKILGIDIKLLLTLQTKVT